MIGAMGASVGICLLPVDRFIVMNVVVVRSC